MHAISKHVNIIRILLWFLFREMLTDTLKNSARYVVHDVFAFLRRPLGVRLIKCISSATIREKVMKRERSDGSIIVNALMMLSMAEVALVMGGDRNAFSSCDMANCMSTGVHMSVGNEVIMGIKETSAEL